MCSLKILKGGRFTESGVFLRFLNTSFWAVLSSSFCQWDSDSFCFRTSFTLDLIVSWEGSAGFSMSFQTSSMVSVRLEFALLRCKFCVLADSAWMARAVSFSSVLFVRRATD